MPSRLECLKHGAATRCAVCDGKFGLVRHYQWRTPLCSQRCIDRFRARQESDRSFLPWFQLAFNPLLENHARMS